MAGRDSFYYQRKAEEAQKREAARLAKRKANPKPYTPKKSDDFVQLYLKDLVEGSRYLLLPVNKEGLEIMGGADDLGLVATVPENAVVTRVQKGSGIVYSRLKIVYGDATISAEMTDWGTRWIRRYDKFPGRTQASYLLPFTIASGIGGLSALITKFRQLFLGDQATKKNILGENGFAELYYGEQVIDRNYQ
jgi:hypothetical protein